MADCKIRPEYEPLEQTCDGKDNDCDGIVDVSHQVQLSPEADVQSQAIISDPEVNEYVRVWKSNKTFDIFAQRYNENLEAIGKQIYVGYGAPRDAASRVQVAAAPIGVHVAWQAQTLKEISVAFVGRDAGVKLLSSAVINSVCPYYDCYSWSLAGRPEVNPLVVLVDRKNDAGVIADVTAKNVFKLEYSTPSSLPKDVKHYEVASVFHPASDGGYELAVAALMIEDQKDVVRVLKLERAGFRQVGESRFSASATHLQLLSTPSGLIQVALESGGLTVRKIGSESKPIDESNIDAESVATSSNENSIALTWSGKPSDGGIDYSLATTLNAATFSRGPLRTIPNATKFSVAWNPRKETYVVIYQLGGGVFARRVCP